jgi:uncharacterized protein YjiS (DUF1127 family)
MTMSAICADDDAICSTGTGSIPVQRGFAAGLKRFVWRVIGWIVQYEEKRLSRIALSELTDEQLADIGVTPSEARREAARPFWS